ncbi:MAG: hypothetical protein ACOVMR_05165, partial [Flavobacteriales bacterium]
LSEGMHFRMRSRMKMKMKRARSQECVLLIQKESQEHETLSQNPILTSLSKAPQKPRSTHAVKSSLIFGLEVEFFWDEIIMPVKIECIIHLEPNRFCETLNTDTSVFFGGLSITFSF